MEQPVNQSGCAYGYLVSFSIVLFLLLFASLAFLGLWYGRYQKAEKILSQDIAQLEQIFTKINNTAGILGFDYQKNWINFLQIKKDGFVGSEVGSMNLIYPKKWDGPYVRDNPTYKGIEYQVVRVKEGYFIVPGEGVTLPNGQRMGTDIVLDEDTDITEVMENPAGLNYEDTVFAAPVPMGGSASSVVRGMAKEE